MPHPLVPTIRPLAGREAEIASRDELDDLGLQGSVRIDEARQRPIEKTLPEAGKRPGTGVLERGRPIAFDVAGTDRLIQERFGLERRNDASAERLAAR